MIKPLIAALLLQLAAFNSLEQGELLDGGSLMYVGVWPNKILVIDERDHKVVKKIELESGVPEWIMASYDKRRLVTITHHRNVEVIDLATHKVIGQISLGEPNRRPVVINSVIGPRGRYLYIVMRSAVKEVDRYTVEKAKFYIVDLDKKEIAKQFDFPAGFDEIFGFADAGFKISEDEKLLYLFGDDVLIFDLENFKQVDKIELSKPLHPGFFPVSFDGEFDPDEEPGLVTSIFAATDPLSRRPVAGIATVNLRTKNIDLLIPFGPALPTRGRLFLSPDRKKAYVVVVNDAQDPNRRPEFWVFDLEARKLLKRVEFENRPRFTFMPSGDAKSLYVYGPGPIIDVYNSETLKLEKTVTVEGDIIEVAVLRSRP
jgi:hypothetical protein